MTKRTKAQIEAQKHLIRFPKGVSGNPGGKPKSPDFLKDVRTLPQYTAAKLWSKWLSLDAEAVKAQGENWKLNALELAICRAILSDIERGELRNIEQGLSRICGKLGDAPPSTGEEGLEGLSEEELLARVRKAVRVMEGVGAPIAEEVE